MKKKLMYEVPDAELIELKLDQSVIMVSGENNTVQDVEEEDWGNI